MSDTYKVCLAGETGVGKTAIMQRLTNNGFDPYSDSTIGAAFNTLDVKKQDIEFKLEFWDTAGQERYSTLLPIYFRGSQVVIIVASVIDYSMSIKRAVKIINQIQNIDEEIEFIFILNKVDLLEKKKDKLTEICQYYQKKIIEETSILDVRFIHLTSAKLNQGISDVIDDFCNLIRTEIIFPASKKKKSLKLNDLTKSERKSIFSFPCC